MLVTMLRTLAGFIVDWFAGAYHLSSRTTAIRRCVFQFYIDLAMNIYRAQLLIFFFVVGIPAAAAALPTPPPTVTVPLTVSSGVPLRLYITQRLRMRKGEQVHAKLMEPIYAFDREVVPAGSEVLGHITSFDPASKRERAEAILGGDFTPLHAARVEFTTILMPDGSQREIHTVESPGLDSFYIPPQPTKKKQAKISPGKQSGALDTVKKQVGTQIHGQIRARTRGLADLIHGPNRVERLRDFLITKLPYHPQWYPRGTRFDAVLRDPINFGDATISAEALQPARLEPEDAIGKVRLLETVTSAAAQRDDTVQGILSQPLLSPENKLILPEGTHLTGTVRLVRPARRFHRNGQLRFSFDQIELPAFATLPPRLMPRAEAQVVSVEGGEMAGVKTDEEGTTKATESKGRLLGPMLAVLVANKSLESETGDAPGEVGSASGNYSGRAAGGFSGFGLLGVLASRGSRHIGAALGFYGLAWSVYATIIARGHEVEFPKNTVLEVRFRSRSRKTPLAIDNRLAEVP